MKVGAAEKGWSGMPGGSIGFVSHALQRRMDSIVPGPRLNDLWTPTTAAVIDYSLNDCASSGPGVA